MFMAMIRWRWCASIIDRWRLQKKQPQGTLQGDSVVFETVQVLMVYNIFAMIYITFAIQWCSQYIHYLCSGAQQFLKKKHPQETILQGDSRCWFSQFAIPSPYKSLSCSEKGGRETQNLSETLSRPWEWGCGVTDRCLTCQI